MMDKTFQNSDYLWCYGLVAPIYSLGPGPRAGLWVTGCQRGCPGCQSPFLQQRSAGWPTPVSVITQRLLSRDTGWCGLTISGGEPFEQVPALIALLEQLKASRPHWNIITFTGYRYQQLTTHLAQRRLLEHIDLLIDGPFIESIPSRYPLTGSGNQQLLALTTQGEKLREDIMTHAQPHGELAHDSIGNTLWIGFPPEMPSNTNNEWWENDGA